MSKYPVRIILVDDHPLARESWSRLLSYDERLKVIHETDHGDDAVEKAAQLQPDLMLVDINMHPVNGFEVTQRVLEKNPSINVIGISVNNHPSYAYRMLDLGAKGFVTKSSSYEEILQAILTVHEGEQYICTEIEQGM